MSYLSLYRKWRPGTFEDVLGQAHVTETLAAALREDRISHAYLFAGPRGTGKTSTARILAKALNCEKGITPTPCGECSSCRQIADGSSLDVFEMDAASHTSVDDVREIRDRIPFAAVAGGHKVYIIDEAHQLSGPAFNALLKMLEEPPSHVIFVLCTTESHKLPATVVSRCQRFEFRRLSSALLAEHLGNVAKAEGAGIEEGALRRVARHAHGSVRDALSILDQIAGPSDGTITEAMVVDLLGEAPEEVLLELGDAVASNDVLSAFRGVERVIERGWDPRQLLRQLLEHLRSLYLVRRGAGELLDLDDDQIARLREQSEKFTPSHLEWALRVLGQSQADVRWSSHPRLTLEVALARASKLEAEDSQALRARVERLERVLLTGAAPQARAGAGAPATQSRPQPAPSRAPAARAASVSSKPQASAAPTPKEPAPAENVAAHGAEPAEPENAQAVPEPSEIAEAEPGREGPAPDASLEEQWAAFLEGVRSRKRTTHALLKEAWPVEVADGVLLAGFEKSFHAEAIQRTEHTPHLTAALEEAFGAKLRLKPQVLQGQRPGGGQAMMTEIDPERAVDLVMRGLGAEIVEEVES